MKHVVFILTAVSVIFLIGCQDSNMTAPSANSNTSSSYQSFKPTPQTGTILLKGEVVASNGTPGSGLVFQVTGEIAYEYKFTGQDINQAIEFSINTHANLVPASPILPSGSGSDQSVYSILTANKTGVIYVQRDCFVPELNAKLHIAIGIGEDNSFSVESMWIDDITTVGNGAHTN